MSYAFDTEPQSIAEVDDTPGAQANAALSEANTLHKMLDELELRLFGPTPKGVPGNISQGADAAPPALAHTIRHTRQRLDSATSRLGSVLHRI